ncbi:MAG: CoA transferase [Chloroflexi bacterium]|nr:CoA transferase [Chloroflexota bacterium]
MPLAELLEGIRVLELAQGVAGPHAGKLLAEYGADVLKVEPPGGDESRAAGPFKGDIPHPETSALFLNLNRNKRSITLSLETEEGRAIFLRLAAEADVVIENFRPGQLAACGIGYDVLSRERPDLVLASITPFGQTGPWRDYRGSEITLQAVGGPLHSNGTPTREPAKLGGSIAHYHCGVAVAFAIVLARLRVEQGGSGDWIDQAVYEAQAGFRDRRAIGLTAAGYAGMSSHRQRPASRAAVGVRPAIDGHVNILGGGSRHFGALLDLIGRPDLKEHPDFGKLVVGYSPAYAEQVEGSYIAWLFETPKKEAVAQAQARGILGGAILSVADLLSDEHYRGRGAFEAIDHPVAGEAEYAGRQLLLSETPRPPARRAPLLGEHNDEVYFDRLGYDGAALARLRGRGVI